MEQTNHSPVGALTPRPSAVSRSESTQIIMPPHINGAGRLFGGVLMQWIDTLASIVAMRHSGHSVTTAAVDTLEFRGPAFQGEMVVLEGKVTWTGHTSMEIRVDTWVEERGVRKRLINRAYLIMVAMDEQDHPVAVPPLLVQTDEEQAEWQMATKRKEARRHVLEAQLKANV